MLADQPQAPPAIGEPDATILDAGAFHEAIIQLIEGELPVWRDRPDRPTLEDEPHLNEFFCGHLNSASRRRKFDAVQFLPEPLQAAGRRADIAVKPLGTIVVEARIYHDWQQLLPIECKRLPTPATANRSDLEYVEGLPGHRTGSIERFKYALHGHLNDRALLIAYVQEGTFDQWLTRINARLDSLAVGGATGSFWHPPELLSGKPAVLPHRVRRFTSHHRRHAVSAVTGVIELEHLWLLMN